MRRFDVRIRLMTLIINTIDEGQEKAVIAFLKEQHISFSQRQTLEEYNQELEENDAAIDRGEFTTNNDLKNEIKGW